MVLRSSGLCGMRGDPYYPRVWTTKRKIHGIGNTHARKSSWKSRTNRELEEMNKGETIVKWIKGQRISWLGHLERMGEDRMPKKIFTQELEGTRRRGRLRKSWKEEVERDLQLLGVRRWRELVADRKKMEGHCSTGQSPQWAVVPMEEEYEATKTTVSHSTKICI